ncbi:hypothetical protein [Phycicoccus sp. SLBN-51]|uniref:hypothetical protein n=1 Tax=Phycicoccus sp. SLBN-51 TaxID=2768447 RepID=UPI001154030F|nr:hypothetical protein [Phycicoccus sp. SLBN-51]TQJ51840.1 hypothetical protein FBY26_3578 [Phycicoccus sp. SLBN-51]
MEGKLQFAKWIIRAAVMPLVVASTGTYATIQVARAQFLEPSAMYCTDLRQRVLEQFASEPSSIKALYPRASEEEERCQINEFMNTIAAGSAQRSR